MSKPFLGIGWSFPLEVVKKGPQDNKKAGQLHTAEYEESVRQSIWLILGTAKGERVMRPDFGADLKRLAFAPNNTSTAGLAIFYVQEALKKWEPRIELLNVDANPDSESGQILLITIEYRIVSTNTEHNLVYPFYLGSQ